MRPHTLFLFLITAIGFANTENGTSSKLKNVTVYLSGAQIERTATINVPAGTTEFVFDRLSPNIDESSIQVSGLKNTAILSINYSINHLIKQETSKAVQDLKEQMTNLRNAIEAEKHTIAGFSEELQLITHNRSLGNTQEVVNLEKLKQFASYYRARTTEIKSQIHASNNKISDFHDDISDLQKQLNELNVDEKVQTGEIKIKLNAASKTDLNLMIKYNVTGAGWFPIYDIKADKINAPIQLAYKAHVYQNTGVDWNDVTLTLSTSDPNTNNIKPDINPKYLNFISQYNNRRTSRATKNYGYKYNPTIKTVSGVITSYTDGLPLPGATVRVKGTNISTQTDFDGKYSLNITNGQELEISYVGSQTETLPIHSGTMNFTMKEDISALDEVVVIAQGIKRERSSGYNNAVQTMIDKDIDNEQLYIEPKNYTSHGDLIEEGITNTRFEIKKTHSIPNDGDVTVIEIENYNVPAKYEYFAAPVLNENVFLTAKIENWEQYNLLPAEANVYFEGSYSGKTNINPHSTTEELTISLGVDPNVIVKRTQPKDFKKNTFIGGNRVISKQYEIELKNNKSSAIDIVLYDRIPISQNKAIKIDDIDTGTSEYDDKKGLLKWTLNIDANDKSDHSFSYTVKYPKYQRINL